MQPEDAVPPLKIFGDSSKEGFYIYRNRFGPKQTSRPITTTRIAGAW
jgi:hypothetical protein